jgi:adenylate cyclase
MPGGDKEVRPLTSVELLDAAVWREIGTEDPQPAPAFLEALSTLLGRWLVVRSTAPEMDAVTVLCRVRGYIARHGRARGDADLQDENGESQ